jgi:hypothetical protein
MGGGRRPLHALWAVSLALLTLCSPAVAQRRATATFAATAEGTETVSATKAAEGETCPAGTGSETVTFDGRPFRIRVEDTGPFLEMIGLSRHGEDSRQTFAASGTVTRAADGAFTCGLQTAPDCGTKPFSGVSMWLQGTSVRRGRITLLVDLHAEDPPDVFASCPLLGGFPALFATGVPQAQVAGTTLFDRRRHTLVISASHDRTAEDSGGTSDIAMSLKLTLRRL